MGITVIDHTIFYSLLNIYVFGLVCVWALYVWTFHQFHGGHIVLLDYTPLLKKEVQKVHIERKKAANPIL